MTTNRGDQHLPDLDTLWDFDNPAASEARFRDLLLSAAASSDCGGHTADPPFTRPRGRGAGTATIPAGRPRWIEAP